MTDGSVDAVDVTVDRAARTVLEAVDLTVDEGRFVGIVGPNGAGKTTLLRTIGGVLAPETGTVRLGGDALGELAQREVGRRAASVPQETELAFDFGVRDVVEMGRYPHRDRFGEPDDDHVVADAIARAEAEELTGRAFGELSAGERRRVLLARALAQDAPVILVDEPTSNLDVRHARRVMTLLDDLVDDRGATVVAAIHELDAAARHCDRVAVLDDGVMRARGRPRDVMTAELLTDVYGTEVAVTSDPLTGEPTVTAHRVGDGDDHVHVLGPGDATLPDVYDELRAGNAVTAGPVVADGVVAGTLTELDVDHVAVEPLQGLPAEAERAVTERIAAADRTVVTSSTPDRVIAALDAPLREARVVRRDGTPVAGQGGHGAPTPAADGGPPGADAESPGDASDGAVAGSEER